MPGATETKFDWQQEYLLYRALRNDANQRNLDWWVLRQAFLGVYRWPTDWPSFKEKLRVPLLRKMVLTHAAFLVGQRFGIAVEPLTQKANARGAATVAEKALGLLIEQCGGWAHINRAAILGSLLGTSGFKVYMEETGGEPRACFTAIQPELCYPVTRGDDATNIVKVYYGYKMDRRSAANQFGLEPDKLKTEQEVEQDFKTSPVASSLDRASSATRNYIVTGNYAGSLSAERQRQLIPVLEVWDDFAYAVFVGGEEVKNEANPYGFIPYTLIPNIDAGFGVFGESDVDQVLELNEELNRMLSDYVYTMHRWANPTLLWNRPPKNYQEVAANILGGGGVIPLPVGSELRFLEYMGAAPDFSGLMDRLRGAGVEMSNLSELAFSGEAGGSINTGASLAVNFTNVAATQSLKKTNWDVGLKRLLFQLAALGAQMGDIGVIKTPGAGSSKATGTALTGESIGEHRRVKILWPGLLPKDSEAAARLEIDKMDRGVQSRYSTIEKLGEDYPEDELDRIKEEAADQSLNPQGQASLIRANATNTVANAKAQQMAQGGGAGGDPTAAVPDDIEGDLGVPPDDVGQVTDTGEDFGTDPLGNVRDAQGRRLDETGGDLARFFAASGQGARGAPSEEEPPPEEAPEDELFGIER